MPRVPELDALRGIAAVVIVVYHLRFNNRFPMLGSAVDLFFVLSGYLITTIILQTYQKPRFLAVFYARRGLRIFPIYYLTIGLYLLVHPLLNGPRALDALPYFLTYTQLIQGYWGGTFPAFDRLFVHTWSLAIEEQFYLIWPALVMLAGRRRLPALVAALLCVPFAARALGAFPMILLTRCDGLLLGAGLACLLFDRDRVERRRTDFGRAFGGIALAGISYPLWRAPIGTLAARCWPASLQVLDSFNWLRISLVYFAIVGLVVCYQAHPWLRGLRRRWLVGLGTISYGIYLYHPFVFAIVALIHFRLGLRGSLGMDGLKLLATIGVAALSWKWIEQPILRWKDRFVYDEPRTPVRAPQLPGASAALQSTAR